MEITLIIITLFLLFALVVRTYRDIKVKEIDKERQIALKSLEMMSGNGHKDNENYCKQTFAQASIQGFKQSNDKNALTKIWDVFISYNYKVDRVSMECLKQFFDEAGISCFPDNLVSNRTCGWDAVKNAMRLSAHFVIVISKESLIHIENSSTYSREIKQIGEFVDNLDDPRKCYVAICDGIQVNHAIITLLNDEKLCADDDLKLALEKIKERKAGVYGFTSFCDLAKDIKESKRTLWK